MKQKLLDDLIAFLKASPDPSFSIDRDERDRLIVELQAARDALVYKPVTKYRLKRHYVRKTTEYIDGKFTGVFHPCESNIPACPRTPNLELMKKNVRKMLEIYPLDELRLYHGSRRIRDIESWLEEVE